jgi:hypothetical protein
MAQECHQEEKSNYRLWRHGLHSNSTISRHKRIRTLTPGKDSSISLLNSLILSIEIASLQNVYISQLHRIL